MTARITELPDGPSDDTGLTPRQQAILRVIRESVDSRGYPPSVREIGEKVGLTSPSSVAYQLRTLAAKGFLKRDPRLPRAIAVAASSSSNTTASRCTKACSPTSRSRSTARSRRRSRSTVRGRSRSGR